MLQPPGVLQIGPAGSGKTSAIATQLLAGLEVFVIITEPDGASSLIDAAERLKAPIDRLHWTTCLPASAGWKGLEDMVGKISSMDQKGLADVKDMGKADFRDAAMRFLGMLKDFYCQRTGQNYGSFTQWDDTRSLNIDSLTGWSHIGWGTTVGYKPTANPGEWGIAQNFIANLLLKIQNDRQCFFSLTAHPEKEMDEMIGVKKIMVSTIGAKLAPKVPTFFSEVVQSKRFTDTTGRVQFLWSNSEIGMDLKNRSLPISSTLSPDFRPIVEAYRRKKALVGAQPQTPQGQAAPPPTAPVLPAAPLTPSGTRST